MNEPDFQERVWQAVHSIPKGKVASYGQIAAWAGHPRGARQVGRILSALPVGTRLPWHRVLGAGGRISLPGGSGEEQRRRLEKEGVRFNGQRVAPEHRL